MEKTGREKTVHFPTFAVTRALQSLFACFLWNIGPIHGLFYLPKQIQNKLYWRTVKLFTVLNFLKQVCLPQSPLIIISFYIIYYTTGKCTHLLVSPVKSVC